MRVSSGLRSQTLKHHGEDIRSKEPEAADKWSPPSAKQVAGCSVAQKEKKRQSAAAFDQLPNCIRLPQSLRYTAKADDVARSKALR